MATIANRSSVGREKPQDDLFTQFRNAAFSAGAYDVTESELRSAFEEEVKQPGGREALASTLSHICPPTYLPYDANVDAVVTFKATQATLDIDIPELQFKVSGAFKGGMFVSGVYNLRGTVRYDSLDDWQGVKRAKMFKSPRGSELIIEVYPPGSSYPLLAYIVLQRAYFALNGDKPGTVNFMPYE